MARTGDYPADLATMDERALRQVVTAMTADWDPRVGEFVRRAELGSVRVFDFHAPAGYAPDGIPTWPSSTVTLIGDAVHPMPPTGGIGASTALRDAAVLTEQLGTVERGGINLTVGVWAYENAMRAYGFDAVRVSMRNLNRLVRLDNRVRYLAATRIGFPMAELVRRTRRFAGR